MLRHLWEVADNTDDSCPMRLRDLVVVLGKVRLDVQVREFAGEGGRRLHLCRCRGNGEARRDGDVVAAPAMPVCNHFASLVIARLRRVEQPLRRMPIHHDLATDHAHVAAHGFGEEGVG